MSPRRIVFFLLPHSLSLSPLLDVVRFSSGALWFIARVRYYTREVAGEEKSLKSLIMAPGTRERDAKCCN